MNRFAASTLVLVALFIGSSPAAAATATSSHPGVLRYAFPSAETGFDPQQISDVYSNFVASNIFDPLLTYDYLARPVKLVPNTAEAMPEISPDGLTMTVRIRKGIWFSDDPAFGGRRRELTAADYVYSIKRVYDPKVKSPQLYNIEGFVVGMDELRAKAIETGTMDYDTPVEGLKAIDRYTLRIRLTKTNFNFLNQLAFCPISCAVAREVVHGAPEKAMEHPVGTGPYVLAEWRRSSRIVLTASPTYRERYYDGQPADDDRVAQAIYAQMKGRRLPMTPRVEVSIIEQTQPRWLAFLNSETDLIERLPEEFANQAIPNGKLAPNLAKRAIKLDRNPGEEITYTFFNMEDPIVGGYTPDKIALRRAVSLGYNTPEEIRVLRRNQAIAAESPIGPGAIGYDPNFHSIGPEYDPAKARALLDMYGYVDRDGDGYRELPDGRPMVLERYSQPTQVYKEMDELWKKCMDAIGVKIIVKKQQFPELVKQGKAGQLMMWGLAWSANTPDAETFYSTLYGGGVGQINYARFDLPEFNALFDQVRALPSGPQRAELYLRMNKLVLVYAPWKLGVHRIYTDLLQPWVYGYHRHPVLNAWWSYVDVDGDQQQKALGHDDGAWADAAGATLLHPMYPPADLVSMAATDNVVPHRFDTGIAMNHIKPLRAASGAVLIGLCFGAHAQSLKYNPSVYIAPEAGYFNPDNRFGTRDTGAEFGLKVGKAINPWFDFQVGASYARVRANGDRYQQATAGVDGRFFVNRDRFRPFLEIGAGAENDRRNLPNHQNSRTSPYASAGAGVQYAISDQFAAELEYKKVFGFQRSNAFGFRRNENNYVTLGLTYFFDKPAAAPVRYEAPAPAPVAQSAPPAPPPPPPPAPRFEKQTMSAQELFAFDRADLRGPQPKLDDIVALLKANPDVANVRITGYTDRLGSQAYNLKLSQRRAAAVKTYLVAHGIDAGRLTTTGKGEADPVVQCSERNRAALIRCLEPNRRVEVEDITVQRRVQ